jgi:hypothetical protein
VWKNKERNQWAKKKQSITVIRQQFQNWRKGNMMIVI